MNRRNFLKVAGSTLASLPVMPVLAQLRAQGTVATARSAGMAQNEFAMDVDGAPVGWVSSVEGGHAFADVTLENPGPDHVVRKHIGAVKYEDITVSCGLGMSKAMYEWMQSTMTGKYQRKNGAITAADFNFKAISTMQFFNALITEIAFPALDASSKDAAHITVKFSPEYTKTAKGGTAPARTIDKIQKHWLPSNFKLTIGDLDCTGVAKIDALVIKQKLTQADVGQVRDYAKEPRPVEISNLAVSISEAKAQSFYDWQEDFIIKGNSHSEKQGTLQFLAPDMSPLMELSLVNLGIFKCTPEKMEAGSENIRRVRAEMYCEQILISKPPA